jgi:predicted ATPase
VAEDLTPHFADGVAFVPLAAVTDTSLIPAAIAQQLGVREHGGRPITDRRSARGGTPRPTAAARAG